MKERTQKRLQKDIFFIKILNTPLESRPFVWGQIPNRCSGDERSEVSMILGQLRDEPLSRVMERCWGCWRIIRTELGECEGKDGPIPKAHGLLKYAYVFIRIHSPILTDVPKILVISLFMRWSFIQKKRKQEKPVVQVFFFYFTSTKLIVHYNKARNNISDQQQSTTTLTEWVR